MLDAWTHKRLIGNEKADAKSNLSVDLTDSLVDFPLRRQLKKNLEP